MVMAPMANLSRTKAQPIPVIRSTRVLDRRCLTSLPVGKMVPIDAFGLLREDQVQSTRIRINFEMLETVEILMNAVRVRAMAYLVPFTAFERFNGIDQLNRAYEKVPDVAGGPVTPYYTTGVFASANQPVLTYMGKHAKEGATVNWAYVEAYNSIWNYRARNRSPDITLRNINDVSLAKAFWVHSQFAAVVPDFDQAIIDGEVPLNITDAAIKIKGTENSGGYNADRAIAAMFRSTNPSVPVGFHQAASVNTVTTTSANQAAPADLQMYLDCRFIAAEMAENGITISLSNIEMARKTQAFAALRKQYTGITDEYVLDLLMSGITVPEQAWREPMLIADRSTIFGMAKRYSSTADDLTASVVNGATFIDMPLRTPRCPMGGVVMVCVEVMPEQLFEREKDPFFFVTDPEQLPDFLKDTLDPEKVEIVENGFVDTDHDTPTATFGYAPLNWKWNASPPSIGGKFYRPTVDAAFDEARQRIWAIETQNPTLSEDFYLCTNMHMKPFVVQNQDNFECVMRGVVPITGNTVFGNVLIEASDDYDTVMAKIDQDRIDKEAAAAAAVAAAPAESDETE